jgi:hypothetical protein
MLGRPALLDRVLKFIQVLNTQIAHTAACNAHHNLQERLARWLLLAHDRAESDALPLAQEFIAIVLAVRRPGSPSQRARCRRPLRSSVSAPAIRDRGLLEEISCQCYGVVRDLYRRILGGPS